MLNKILNLLSIIIFILLVIFSHKDKLNIDNHIFNFLFKENYMFIIYLLWLLIIPAIINRKKIKNFFQQQEKVGEYLKEREKYDDKNKEIIDKKVGYVEPKKLYYLLFISIFVWFLVSYLHLGKIGIFILIIIPLLLFAWLVWTIIKKQK